MEKDLSVVGKRVRNKDGPAIATGQALYTSDLRIPGMLEGKVLRSPYPHARIISLNTQKAEALPGVLGVVTANDTPKKRYLYLGIDYADRLPLADSKVRFTGEEVAAVVALDEETAEEALGLIDVKYEPLQAIYDPVEAMQPGTALIHDDKENNIASHGSRTFGDPDNAFAMAAVVVEGEYQTQPVQHCCMEPYCSIAQWTLDGFLDIWTSTQAPFYIQKEVAHVLDLDPNRIRVRRTFVGGGFGGRSKVAETEAIAVLLARKVLGRPVRIRLSRSEEFEVRTARVPMRIKLRTAADEEGRLLARDMTVVADNGAYNHCAPSVAAVAATKAYALYRVPNVRSEHYTVYTNKHTMAQMRGFGGPQAVFAIEAQMDEIAEKLGLDPYELRLKNALEPNETLINGWQVTSCGMKECIERVAEAIDWKKRIHKIKGRGVGMACVIQGSGGRWYKDGDYSSAIIRVGHDGIVFLETGAVDIGQGASTTLAQVAAESLGSNVNNIKTVTMDTDRTPSDMGAFASKTAFLAGNAVRVAALDAREQLLAYAADLLEVDQAELYIAHDYVFIVGDSPERCMPINDLVLENPSRIGRHIVGKGFWESRNTELFNRKTGYGNTCSTYLFGAHAAEVEVDETTGQVRVIRVIAAHDVGRAINPTVVEGQIEGGVSQGLGYALMEEQAWDEQGRVVTNKFMLHKIPTALDMPEIVPIIVETTDPLGPYGAKGVGEPAMTASPAAIANAIFDATGARITSLPITPEKVLDALQKKLSA